LSARYLFVSIATTSAHTAAPVERATASAATCFGEGISGWYYDQTFSSCKQSRQNMMYPD